MKINLNKKQLIIIIKLSYLCKSIDMKYKEFEMKRNVLNEKNKFNFFILCIIIV